MGGAGGRQTAGRRPAARPLEDARQSAAHAVGPGDIVCCSSPAGCCCRSGRPALDRLHPRDDRVAAIFCRSCSRIVPRRPGITRAQPSRARSARICGWRSAQIGASASPSSPHQAWLMGDAIVRTLFRLFVSRRHLLEWVTAAQASGQPAAQARSASIGRWPAASLSASGGRDRRAGRSAGVMAGGAAFRCCSGSRRRRSRCWISRSPRSASQLSASSEDEARTCG